MDRGDEVSTVVAPRGDTTPLRWLVGAELARYRSATQLSLAAAAEQLGMSKAKLGHLETGRQQQAPHDIAHLLRTYGAAQHEIDRLSSLAGRADEATWWAPWAHVVPDWLKTYIGLEGLADGEFTFEPSIIPGLLQTEEYAAAATADTPRVRPDHGERFVGFRMARTRRLYDEDRPLRLHAVIAEAALRLAVGHPDVRRNQMRHIIDLAKRSNITVQVVRPEDGFHTSITGPYVLLDFDQVRSIAYCELHDGAVYVQDPDEVESYKLAAETLQRVALGPDQSVALLESMIDT